MSRALKITSLALAVPVAGVVVFSAAGAAPAASTGQKVHYSATLAGQKMHYGVQLDVRTWLASAARSKMFYGAKPA